MGIIKLCNVSLVHGRSEPDSIYITSDSGSFGFWRLDNRNLLYKEYVRHGIGFLLQSQSPMGRPL